MQYLCPVPTDIFYPGTSWPGTSKGITKKKPGKNPHHQSITSNAAHMGQLMDDLLSFSRLTRKELKLYRVDMYVMVKACINELTENISKSHDIKIAELPPCDADSSLIKQVWMNLLDNAVKYSSKKEHPHIEVGFKNDKTKTIYFVKDNGVGFDMIYKDKLFTVFHRLHRKDEFEGTGVGLALAKRIVDRHGGKIWFSAMPGKGATFYFSIPKKDYVN